MRHSEWAVVGTKDGIVFVKDLDGAKSVTNDAEFVLQAIRNSYGRAARVVYEDTEQEWWEILCLAGPEPGDWRIGFERWHGFTWDKIKNAERYN